MAIVLNGRLYKSIFKDYYYVKTSRILFSYIIYFQERPVACATGEFPGFEIYKDNCLHWEVKSQKDYIAALEIEKPRNRIMALEIEKPEKQIKGKLKTRKSNRWELKS
ncbi:hypothetical protein ACSAZK_11390 [Methanosarcina sp. Mfa9]|uniref:hypothetical protein n=1 Tax=Methanosarcina sp. Mfa9 TaxID=3439063 RepID=UPI003F870BA5